MANGNTGNSILEQLYNLNLLQPGSGFSQLSQITPETISGQMTSMYDLGPGVLKPGMFSTISGDLINQIMPQTYSPILETASKPHLKTLLSSFTGREAIDAAGGFAGTSAIKSKQKEARDVYGKEMAGVLSQSRQGQRTAFDKIQNIVNQWLETAQSV